MYSIAPGQDEYSSLISRPATSAPASNLYQNFDEDLTLNYGSVRVNNVPQPHNTINMLNQIKIGKTFKNVKI